MQEPWQQILPYLPAEIAALVQALPQPGLQALEELRFNLGRPVLCRFHQGEAFLGAAGGFQETPTDALIFQPEQLRKMVLLLSDSSFYALEEELCRGYITLPGGHRAGLAGRAVLEQGRIKTLKEISAINLRLARHLPDVASELLPELFAPNGGLYQTLLISPPRAGKTTLLRDLARQLADGLVAPPLRVGIVDERSELAAMRHGLAQLPVGLRTDVLDGCPKAEGLVLLLRSMSPEVLICDEIGRAEDALALREAANAGVKVIASAHGSDAEEIRHRPVLAELLAEQAFERLVVISRRQGPGTIEVVLDGAGQPLPRRVAADA